MKWLCNFVHSWEMWTDTRMTKHIIDDNENIVTSREVDVQVRKCVRCGKKSVRIIPMEM